MRAVQPASREVPASLGGRVQLADGTPVADVAVLIASGPALHPDIAALSAADGSFRFDDLAPGSYTLLINAEGHRQVTVRRTLESGESAEMSVRLP